MDKKYPRMGAAPHVEHGMASTEAGIKIDSVRADRLPDTRRASHVTSFCDHTKWEVMERTLRDGMTYLGLQDDKLSATGCLLDDCLSTLNRSERSASRENVTAGKLAGEIVALSLEGLLNECHKGVPLFDDGRAPPLKFNLLENGLRRTIELPKCNLARPALNALRLSAGCAPPSKNTVLEAIKEILQLRTLNHSQADRLGTALAAIESKMLSGRRNRALLLGAKPSGELKRKRPVPPSLSFRPKGGLASFITRTGRLLGISRPVITPLSAS